MLKYAKQFFYTIGPDMLADIFLKRDLKKTLLNLRSIAETVNV